MDAQLSYPLQQQYNIYGIAPVDTYSSTRRTCTYNCPGGLGVYVYNCAGHISKQLPLNRYPQANTIAQDRQGVYGRGMGEPVYGGSIKCSCNLYK